MYHDAKELEELKEDWHTIKSCLIGFVLGAISCYLYLQMRR